MTAIVNNYWSSVYSQVCNAILEPGGLQLGLLTPTQFYALAQEVLTDFFGKTGMVKSIFNIRMQVGIPSYPEPDQLGDVDTALASQGYLHRTSGYYLDNSNAAWPSDFNAPVEFREDELPVSTLQLVPNPNTTGNDIATTNAGFGVIGAVSSATDFNYTCAGNGFGVVGSFAGNPYLDTEGSGF